MKTKLTLLLLLCISLLSAQKEIADSLVKKAQLKEKDKDYFYAIILVEKAIKADPEDDKLYYYKGSLELSMKNYKESRKTYQTAISKFPTKSTPYMEMGDFFQNVFALDSSLVYFNKAIKMAENDSLKFHYTALRGTTYAKMKKFNKAEKDFLYACKNQPKNPLAVNGLSLTYLSTKEYNKSIYWLKKMVDFDTTASSLTNLGLLYTTVDSLDIAIEYFNKSLAKDKESAFTYSNRGECYYKMKKYDEAMKDINYSIKLNPKNSWAYKNKAKVLIALGKTSDACKELATAESLGYEILYDNEVKELIKANCK